MNTTLKIVICLALIVCAALSVITPIIEFRSMEIGSIIGNYEAWSKAVKYYAIQQLFGLGVCVICVHGAHLIIKTA
ncbi:hypothetical protein G6Z92_18610 [Vibrio aestuarianus subsp. cardii]|uniref:hypothetical protein n=1 Tax=Vibrio aestuarianus TaxID=28171 RepID=UPI0015C561F8|nr:hypothetical protein [Vibrio aestuarianus]NGZ68929.1 hypothetical protein [Vibrio aestuarianus subsp. cardii]